MNWKKIEHDSNASSSEPCGKKKKNVSQFKINYFNFTVIYLDLYFVLYFILYYYFVDIILYININKVWNCLYILQLILDDN